MKSLACIVFVCGVACGGATPLSTTQQQASRELSCSENLVKVQDLENGDLRATGCGQVRDYSCVESDWTQPAERNTWGFSYRRDYRGIPTKYRCVERVTFNVIGGLR
jgi:hypothetical protein